MLDIVANYHRMQFHSKNMIQIQANGEKPDFGPDLGPLNPNSGFHFFFKRFKDNLCFASYTQKDANYLR